MKGRQPIQENMAAQKEKQKFNNKGVRPELERREDRSREGEV
jgi:hypothetical protein